MNVVTQLTQFVGRDVIGVCTIEQEAQLSQTGRAHATSQLTTGRQ